MQEGASQHAQESGSSAPNRRVLLVEDNWVIAMALADDLEDLGIEVIGPANTLDKAMQLLETHEPFAAILDVDLNGTKVYPLAYLLREKQIQFILLTGYELADLPEDLRNSTILNKPIRPEQLERLLADMGVC